MKTLMSMLWSGALAIALPVAAAAAPSSKNLIVVNPTGQLEVSGTVTGALPIVKGRVEIQEGPAFDLFGPLPAGKHFVLTRLVLHFPNTGLSGRALGETTVPLEAVGVQLRDSLSWTGLETQQGVPGVYHVGIPHDDRFTTGDPTFRISTRIADSYFQTPSPKIEKKDQQLSMERPIVEPITGVIDLINGTFSLRAVFKYHKYVPIFDDVDVTFVLTLNGKIGADTDGDGTLDSDDSCPLIANPNNFRLETSPVMVYAPTSVATSTCKPKIIDLGSAVGVDLCYAQAVQVANNLTKLVSGNNDVMWTGTAVSGRTASAMQRVIVTDKTPPVMPSFMDDIIMDDCGTALLFPPKVTDDCGVVSLTNDAPRFFGAGLTVITWKATDFSGNVKTINQNVFVSSCSTTVPGK